MPGTEEVKVDSEFSKIGISISKGVPRDTLVPGTKCERPNFSYSFTNHDTAQGYVYYAHMKQKILNGLLIAVILLIGFTVVGIFVLDGVAQSIIQSKGSEGLGVKVKIDSVHVGFFGKDSSIKGVAIGNPEAFVTDTTPNLLTINEAHIEFSFLQMFDKEVVIPTVTVEGVVLHLQQESGVSNIETVIKSVSHDESPEGTHPEPPFNIETLTISDITVIASGKFTVLDSGPVTAHIKEIVMHNIGSDGDAEVATEAITSAITHAIMDHLANHPAEGLSKMAFSHVTGLINELPVFKQLKIGDALQGVTDAVGKGVDGVLGGLGELFGGGKKD